MREILFRGKLKTNGEWSFGNLNVSLKGAVIITPDETPIGKYGQVIPETVGQYIGLNDSKGIKIFEGDIVKCIDVTNGYEFFACVVFGNPNAEYYWGWQLVTKSKVNKDILCWIDMEDAGAECYVVGNIYDNPELLKEVEQE